MKRRTLAVFALCLVVAAPAFAQKRKSTKKDELATKEKAAKNVVKPESGDDAIRASDLQTEKKIGKLEKRLSENRKRQLANMRGILRRKPLYKGKANLLFRIAEEEWKEAKYRYFLQRKEYEGKYEAYLNGTLKAKPPEPKADYSKALVEYKKLLKEFPNYRRLDEVIFYLGQGLITAGKKKEGASYMVRLTKEYPRSKYKTRAYLAVAEYYFDNDLLFAAKTNYLKVIENKRSNQYPYALYKLGFVYYNLREYEDSIKSFKSVIGMAKDKDRRGVYFKKQSYGPLSLAFAEVPEGWKRARDYFREVGGEELATGRLEKIARIYNKQDKTTLEIDVYEYLISAQKQGKKIPEYAAYITASYKKQEDLGKVEKTINRFVDYFDPKSSWYTVNSQYEEPRIRANQFREEQMDWLITKFHTQAQEVEKLKDLEKADGLYRKAATYYERYIALFPDSKDLYEKEFFLAEIYYFQMKSWDDASKHYRKVVDIDPKGKYSKESAYAIILAKQEKLMDAGLIPRTKQAKKGKKGKRRSQMQKASVTYVKRKKGDNFEPIKKKPLHELQKDFLEACAFFADTYPKNKRVPEVSFLSAEQYIKNGHYVEGINRLEVIMQYHKKHRFAGFAAATLFDANYRLKRWDQMERWGRYMLDTRNFKVLSKKKLLQVIAVSINEYATELAKKGDDKLKAGDRVAGLELKDKAAEQMLRFVKEFPKHEKAAIALFNAAAITEQAERTEKAIDLYESVIKRYAKSPQATESHMVLGLLYESQTDFETAATYFEKMASFPDVPQMADALYNAGSIRKSLEEYDKAIEIFNTFTKKFPEKEDTPTLVIEIAELHEKKGRLKDTLKTYDRYLKAYKKSKPEMVPEIYLRKAEIYQKINDRRTKANMLAALKTATKAYKKLPEEAQKEPKLRSIMGRVRFHQAEFQYKEFEAIRLDYSTDISPRRAINKLKKTLVKKAEMLGKAEKMFFEVLEYKAWGVAAGALYRIGESYYLFAQSLFDLPMPKGLNEDEQFTYRAMLDDRAAPIQEKAISATKKALDLAHKHHVYNEWSRKAGSLLVKLSPERFPVMDDAVVNTDWPVAATFSTTFIPDPGGTLKQMVKAKPKPETPAAAPGKGAAPAQPGAAPAGAKAPAAAPKGDAPAKDAPKKGGGK